MLVLQEDYYRCMTKSDTEQYVNGITITKLSEQI